MLLKMLLGQANLTAIRIKILTQEIFVWLTDYSIAGQFFVHWSHKPIDHIRWFQECICYLLRPSTSVHPPSRQSCRFRRTAAPGRRNVPCLRWTSPVGEKTFSTFFQLRVERAFQRRISAWIASATKCASHDPRQPNVRSSFRLISKFRRNSSKKAFSRWRHFDRRNFSNVGTSTTKKWRRQPQVDSTTRGCVQSEKKN